jgi:predicted metal-binding protein
MANVLTTTLRNPVLQVCLQCGSTQRDEHGCKVANPAALGLATQWKAVAAPLGIRVQKVRCFGHCTAPIAWGVRAENGWGYTFAPAPENPNELAEFLQTWLTASRFGLVPKKEMPPSIRAAYQSRLPSPDYDPHL